MATSGVDLQAAAQRRPSRGAVFAFITFAAMAGGAPAFGADLPLVCPLAVSYVATCGRSFSTLTLHHDELVAIRRVAVQTYATQLRATVRGVEIYDRIFPVPSSDPFVRMRLTALRGSLSPSGAPMIVFGTPRLVGGATTLVSSVSSFAAVTTGVRQQVFLTDYGGPATIGVGDERATPLTIGPGAVDHDRLTVTHVFQQVTQTVVDTFLTSQSWAIDGVARSVGKQHVGLVEAGFAQIERFGESLRARIAAAPEAAAQSLSLSVPPLRKTDPADAAARSGWSSWAGGYGWGGRASVSRLHAEKRRGAGLEAGLIYAPGGGWRLAAGVDQGRARVDQDSLGGRASLDLTEIGLAAMWRGGSSFASLAATAGWGEGEIRQTPPGFAWTARADAPTRVAGLSGEIGHDWRFGALTLTPGVGASIFHVRRGMFAETGSVVALTGPAESWTREKIWIGAAAAQSIDLGAGAFTVSTYARLVGLGGDRRIKAPTTFIGLVTPLQISGPRVGALGADLGAAVDYAVAPSVTARASYDLRLRRGETSHLGAASVTLAF